MAVAGRPHINMRQLAKGRKRAFEASACAKAILAGEHAAVYGMPAVCIPVRSLRARAGVDSAKSGVTIEAPDLGLAGEPGAPGFPGGLEHLAAILRETSGALGIGFDRLKLRVESSIPPARGLGSGAAVSVACARALAGFAGLDLPPETASAIAFEIEKIHHGNPSGVDNATVAFEKAVHFRKGSPPRFVDPGRLTFVLADSGPAPPTASMVSLARGKLGAPGEWILSSFEEIAELAVKALVSGDARALGRLMDRNQMLLSAVGVSTPALDSLCAVAREAGALGAKLTGAGGGGYMIACVMDEDAQAVARALTASGAQGVLATGLGGESVQ